MAKTKFKKLSAGLKKHIVHPNAKKSADHQTLSDTLKNASTPVATFAEHTLNHCNGGATLQAALWLKNHLNNGGKLVVTISGALSSFQIGIMLAELIRKNKVHLVSATGANHEESYYRYVAHSHYAHIPRYTELTPQQEEELRDAGLRRITDTFLPEDESVRIMEPHLLKMWNEAQKKGERYFPHEYFRRLFSEKLIFPDPQANPKDCWTYAAYEKNIPIIVPGFEDSTMGNIFSSYTYRGKYQKKQTARLDQNIMKSGLEYFHFLYDWYMEQSRTSSIAFLQLGGGIAADFPICVVPSLKHDLGLSKVRDWAGFIEIGSSPMSYGSYSGAGGKEKITWDKLSTKSYYQIIQSDVTVVFPWIAAVLLDL
ncbi:MAG: deoxyhypusine synthase [Candidatus Magasanikbacteria bacterium CG10_big_fil_rev_8_21_14_0_10_40_10]|uniref:Deoxyhypusine synthase n=1 Tax=Candidatus Magasanikbacteria bacterium CG10_big_fil_rev_8_21_14_0_10_40_10 TaxID=1974648 RepID=A0A2M6W2J4_9BACT|nr:MAG: deoxyhypusine synthase [Candidatus Magasanikbacteria bacterium CG10_big_fil_rev_8_21_14_0_10_40_10]